MKEYTPDPPRLITWSDLQTVAGFTDQGKRHLLEYYARLGSDKRRLVLSVFQQGLKSAKESTEEGTPDRRAVSKLARDNREEFNDRALLAAIRIVQNREYTSGQEHRARDYKAQAETKRRARWRKSKKQKIIRQYDLIEKLYQKYGSWGAVLKAIKRQPPSGDPNPFAELRREPITAKYLASVMSAERLSRK